MTVHEAQDAVNACETEITREYDDFTTKARAVGTRAVEAAASTRRSKTLMALLICLIGLFVILASHPFWGVVLILVGFFVGYVVDDSASHVCKEVSRSAKTLEETINNNAGI